MDDYRYASMGTTGTDWLTFFRQFVTNPRATASIIPSGKQLTRMMAAALPHGATQVVELGAGTGVVTDALLRRGIEPDNLFVVEMNPDLHNLLRQKHPHAHVIRGDARKVKELLATHNPGAIEADAVCSSLGLLTMPKKVKREILRSVFDVLRPGGVFIQYTYGFSCPVGKECRRALGLQHEQKGFTWRNLPPARVFVYHRG